MGSEFESSTMTAANIEDNSLNTLIAEVNAMPVHISKRFGPARKKPLLVLLLASRVSRGHRSRVFRFDEIADELSQLITQFGGRDRDSRAHPEQPFYHLATSSFWKCVTTSPLTGRRRTPNRSQLVSGELSPEAYAILEDSKDRARLVAAVLAKWFEPDDHPSIRRTLEL
jgi:putative restriction endonuclease